MARTFLQLVERLHEDCGISGTAPVTVVGQTGEAKRLVNSIAEAWVYIQSLHQDWRFQRRSASWVSIAGQAIYTTAECGITAGTFSRWKPYTFRQYLTSVGINSEIHLADLDYDVWRDTWQFNANRNVQAQPWQVAITPANSIALGPKPPAGHTFSGDYYLAPVRMALDADVPALPPAHDDILIVYRAMTKYATFESAPEVWSEGDEGFRTRIALLRADQLPQPSFCGALA